MIRHLFATPSDPVRLVKPGAEAVETTSVLLETATDWWIMIPVVLVGLAAIMTIHLRVVRSRRIPAEERAFRALARAARMPGRFRILTRVLSAAPDAPPPIVMLLSESALSRAAQHIEAKPGSSTDRVLCEFLDARGVADPRPKPAAKPAKRRLGILPTGRPAGTRVNTRA